MKTNTTIKHPKFLGILLAAITLLAGLPSASAIITTFQSGVSGNYSGLTDTYVDYQGDADANWGARNLMLAYNLTGDAPKQKTALLNFDMTSIAGPVTVNSSTLSIYVEGNAERTGGYSQTYNIHAITRSGLNFGTANGTPENGAVSFSAAEYDPTTPVGWGTLSTGTNGPVPGEDYSNSVLGTFTLTSANLSGARVYMSLDTATVASWINTPGTNYGFVIAAVADPAHDQAIIYSSAENVVFAPWLEFDHTAIPEPGTLGMLGLGALITVVLGGRRRRKDPDREPLTQP